MSDDIGGVWRTVGGRRIFIKDGQDLASAMKESGKFKSAKNDVDIDTATLYFRFDFENGFKGKEHKSGFAGWEDRVIDKINDEDEWEDDENGNSKLKNRFLENNYGITREEYDDMSNKEQFKINQKIGIDMGQVTDGASCFELDDTGLEQYKAYIDQNFSIDEYPVVHIFTGKENGEGADGEPVVIPDKVVYEGKTSSIMNFFDKYDYGDEIDYVKMNKDIRNMIKKNNNSKE